MKNNIKDYKGLSEEDKKYLREFDKAIELGMFDDKLVKIPIKMKKCIVNERDGFKRDLMYVNKRNGSDIDGIVLDQKPYVGKKKVVSERDKSGKFTKKEKK